MSPRLQRVVDGIARVVPEVEAFLGGLRPADRFADVAELLVKERRIDFTYEALRVSRRTVGLGACLNLLMLV